MPLLANPRVRNRYYRSHALPPTLTEEHEVVESKPISGRTSILPDVFYSKTHILQYKGWLVIQWGFFKPSTGLESKLSRAIDIPLGKTQTRSDANVRPLV